MADNDGELLIQLLDNTNYNVPFTDPTFRDWSREPGCLTLNFTDHMIHIPWSRISQVEVRKNSGDSFRPVRRGALRQEDGSVSAGLLDRMQGNAGGTLASALHAVLLIEEYLRIGPEDTS